MRSQLLASIVLAASMISACGPSSGASTLESDAHEVAVSIPFFGWVSDPDGMPAQGIGVITPGAPIRGTDMTGSFAVRQTVVPTNVTIRPEVNGAADATFIGVRSYRLFYPLMPWAREPLAPGAGDGPALLTPNGASLTSESKLRWSAPPEESICYARVTGSALDEYFFTEANELALTSIFAERGEALAPGTYRWAVRCFAFSGSIDEALTKEGSIWRELRAPTGTQSAVQSFVVP